MEVGGCFPPKGQVIRKAFPCHEVTMVYLEYGIENIKSDNRDIHFDLKYFSM